VVEAIFRALHLVPTERQARVVEASITLDYTAVLNALFLGLAAVLVWRFLRADGPEMMRMMDQPQPHQVA